jgi:hypothetical protein
MGNGQARPAAGPRSWAATAQLGSCAVFGGLLAALADLVQKEHASAVLKISAVVNTYLGLPLPRWGALLFVVIVAGLVSLIYEADNMQKSFVRGLGILSVVMTAVPYSTPPTQVSFVGAENRSAVHELVVGVALAQTGTTGAVGRADQIPVTLRLLSDRPAPEVPEVTVTVVAPSTGRTIARMVYAKPKPVAGDGRLIQDVSFSLPQGRYLLRIEASGHRIATQEVEVRDAKVTRDVQMQSTKVPLFLQRLGE